MKALFLAMFITQMAFAGGKVLMKDVGIIGLSSHDMFTWDRENEVNLENGRLDLSTIFDYDGGSRWEKGGNPKNGENSPVWTITKTLVNHYKNQLKAGVDSKAARIATVQFFHGMVKDSFTRLAGMDFPKSAINAQVTNTEQATLRALHDILPGKAKTFRGRLYPIKEFKLTNFLFAKFTMNQKELDQEIAYFNGDYDEEYKAIKIPFANKTINLKQVDGDFIAKFSPYNQEEMLAELKRAGDGDIELGDVYFIHHVKELYQKGMCSTDNEWIKTEIKCD